MELTTQTSAALSVASSPKPGALTLPAPLPSLQVYCDHTTALQRQSDLTPEVATEGASLAACRRDAKELAAAAVTGLLKIAAGQLNLTRTFNDGQAALLAADIFKRFYYLKLDEVAYALREGVRGKYGPTYQRLDVEVVSSWLNAYDVAERAPLIERQRVSENQVYKSDNDPADAQRRVMLARYNEVARYARENGLTTPEAIDLFADQLASDADPDMRPYAPAARALAADKRRELREEAERANARRGEAAYRAFRADYYATREEPAAEPDAVVVPLNPNPQAA